MLLCFQVLGCCLLFFLLIRCTVKNDGLNCIYFYPQPYIDEAQKRGLTEKDTAMKRGKRFTLALCLFLLIVLILSLEPCEGFQNRLSPIRPLSRHHQLV